MEKEKVKPLWSENFKDFATSLTVFELWQFYGFYFAYIGVIFMVFYFLQHGSENVFSALFRCCLNV